MKKPCDLATKSIVLGGGPFEYYKIKLKHYINILIII